MDRSLPMLVIGLIFGGGIGFLVAAANGITLDGHDHGVAADHAGHETAGTSSNRHGSHESHDTMLSLPAAGAPTLKIALTADPASGWNLHVTTTGFRFAPRSAGAGHVAGEGHAHVYVNGTKIARLYGPWMHIADLPKGRATVEVTLNSNDHRSLAVGDVPLAARVEVDTE